MEKDKAAAVEEYLQGCAERGFFRSYSRLPAPKGRALFKFIWHQDHPFEVIVDYYKGVIRVPVMLPKVEEFPGLVKDFREFVKECHSEELPEHRRIEKSKLEIKSIVRDGSVSLSAKLKEGSYEYGIDRVVSLIHETFKLFLKDGLYYQYMIDQFGLDPDTDF